MITIKKYIEVEYFGGAVCMSLDLEIDGSHTGEERSRNHFAPSETIIEDVRVGGVSIYDHNSEIHAMIINIIYDHEDEIHEDIRDEYRAQAEYKAEEQAEYYVEMRMQGRYEREQVELLNRRIENDIIKERGNGKTRHKTLV